MRLLPARSSSFLASLVVIFFSVAPAVAQRTVTQDAGSGRKIVMHYNAADQIVETDTLGPNGELLEKDLLEYRPGAYTANALRTSYWPNGKPHKATQTTYDDNSNFTGEFIQVYDESGKQIGGHRLVHEPVANTYTCAEWNAGTQSYQPRECPAGEESEGAPETVKQFTQQEVEQQLERGRKVAQPAPATLVAIPAGKEGAGASAEVGLVLPSHVRPGERVSGSVVENPADYENMAQVTVTRFKLPLEASPQKTLAGWSVMISGEPPQPASGPIALTIPPGQVALAIAFSIDGLKPVASQEIAIPRATRDKSKDAQGWLAPATCVKERVCMVHGEFTGNSSKTFAAFDGKPAKILAETTTALYLAIPNSVDAGPRPLVVAEGSKAIAFPMIVSKVSVTPETRTLSAGEKLVMTVEVDGPEELPDAEWRPGNFPQTNLEEARQLIAGYKTPRAGKEEKEEHEAEERREKAGQGGAAPAEHDEGEGGEILLVVKCASADGVQFGGASNGTYTFRLHRNGFKMGEFKYRFVVSAAKAGGFTARPYLLPMLAPQPGQAFSVTAAE